MKEYHDEKLTNLERLSWSVAAENKKQLSKWGVQNETLSNWLMFLTEEVGELSKAIAEFTYRDGTPEDIHAEAIQVATLSLKIAEMVLVQEIEPWLK